MGYRNITDPVQLEVIAHNLGTSGLSRAELFNASVERRKKDDPIHVFNPRNYAVVPYSHHGSHLGLWAILKRDLIGDDNFQTLLTSNLVSFPADYDKAVIKVGEDGEEQAEIIRGSPPGLLILCLLLQSFLC